MRDHGFTETLDADAEWSDLTSEMYSIIMGCDESKADASTRIKNEQRSEIDSSLRENIAVNATPEQDRRFNEIVEFAWSTNNSYSQPNRETGFNAVEGYCNGNDIDMDQKLYFDCSSFVSAVMQEVYGLDCTKNGKPYVTGDFKRDSEGFFEHTVVEGKVDVSKLKKGQLLLGTNKDGKDQHIMVYIGDGKIMHSNSTYDGISVSNLNGESYGDNGKTTDVFTDVGEAYDNIEILTPKVDEIDEKDI